MTIGFDFGHDFDLDISRSNIEFPISQPKMVLLPWNKMQTYRLNLMPQMWHQVSPWPWPSPWIFKFKYGISYIWAKSGPIVMKRKSNILIELQASNVTNGFELDHNIDLWILKVKCDLYPWPHTWPWPWIFMVNFEIAACQNGRANWHCTKGVAVGHSWPWPFGDQGQVYRSTR